LTVKPGSRYDTAMKNIEQVLLRLTHHLAEHVQDTQSCWDECAWSSVYRVMLQNGTILYLKGTPRRRNEALVTQELHTLCPTAVPRVIIADLMPEEDWRWFVLEDAGRCDQEAISPSIAQEAAYVLGTIQRYAAYDRVLPSLVVGCEADRLQECALDVCSWALGQAAMREKGDIQRIERQLRLATGFFREASAPLKDLPPTIVHGDLWAGNIAVGQTLRLVDWADALWGVGGSSIVRLLRTAHGTLNTVSQALWDAYASGLGAQVELAYQQACAVSNRVNCLVIDREIARSCGRGLSMLAGLVPGLEALATQAARYTPTVVPG
jgi:hypothetical protein